MFLGGAAKNLRMGVYVTFVSQVCLCKRGFGDIPPPKVLT